MQGEVRSTGEVQEDGVQANAAAISLTSLMEEGTRRIQALTEWAIEVSSPGLSGQ